MMSDYDGIKSCEICGEYTTGRLCLACKKQQEIDRLDVIDYATDYETWQGDYQYLEYDDGDYDIEDDIDYSDLYPPRYVMFPLSVLFAYYDYSDKPQLKWRYRRMLQQLTHIWKWHTSKRYRDHWDDIPF